MKQADNQRIEQEEFKGFRIIFNGLKGGLVK